MSARGAGGPVPGLAPRGPLLLSTAVVVAAVVLAWRFLPVAAGALVAALVGAIGLLCVGSLAMTLHQRSLQARPRFASLVARPGPPASPRARDLVAMEEVVESALRYDHDVYLKLRPCLRRLAAARLAERRLDIDRDPAARELLGEAYDLVRADARRPQGELFGPGLPLERLERVIEIMERL